MSFDINVITTKGLELISKATAANPIVWVHAGAETFAIASVENAKRYGEYLWDYFDYPGGYIKSVSVSGNTVRIIAEFDMKFKTGTERYYAFGVCAKLKNQSDNDAIPVLICSTSNEDDGVYFNGGCPVCIQIPFNIVLNDASTTITVTPGNNASISDIERCVMCHKPGNPEEGVDQDIRGIKNIVHSKGDVEVVQNEVIDNGEFAIHTLSKISVSGSTIAEIRSKTEDIYASSIVEINADSFEVNAQKAFIPGLCTRGETPTIGSIILICVPNNANEISPGTIISATENEIYWGNITEITGYSLLHKIPEGRYKLMSYLPAGQANTLAMRIE